MDFVGIRRRIQKSTEVRDTVLAIRVHTGLIGRCYVGFGSVCRDLSPLGVAAPSDVTPF
jgi:hypothetical protein